MQQHHVVTMCKAVGGSWQEGHEQQIGTNAPKHYQNSVHDKVISTEASKPASMLQSIMPAGWHVHGCQDHGLSVVGVQGWHYLWSKGCNALAIQQSAVCEHFSARTLTCECPQIKASGRDSLRVFDCQGQLKASTRV